MKSRSWIFPATAGALFALGLTISGMTNPAKVLAFLDVSGAWDPSLAFVMAGAIGVHAVLYRRIGRRAAPLFDAAFHAPAPKKVDGRLVAGAALFGLGWGVAGYCPGPALASVTSLPAMLFVATMAVGFLSHRWIVTSRPTLAAPIATGSVDG